MDEATQFSHDSRLSNRLYQSRIITISGGINQDLADEVMQKLLAFEAESDDPIRLFINSQGGHVEAGDTIHDMIRFVKPKVYIIGTGYVASAGALIFVAVPVEQRYCLPNTRFLLHQPAGQAGGAASDMEIQMEEIIKMRRRINEIFARQTGQPLERVEKDADRDFWLTADEAKEYGLLGHIINNASEIA